MQRRHSLAVLSLASAAPVLPGTSAWAQGVATAPKSKWAGSWADPDAPGCGRKIIVSFDGTTARITGEVSIGNPNLDLAQQSRRKENKVPGACSTGDKKAKWNAKAELTSRDADEMKIDFSSARGPRDVVAKWSDGSILFPDGKKWTKLR